MNDDDMNGGWNGGSNGGSIGSNNGGSNGSHNGGSNGSHNGGSNKFPFKNEESSDTLVHHRQKKIDLIEKEKKIRNEIIEGNNGWNSYLETIVSNIGEKCAGQKWMHGKCVNFYNFWYHFIGVFVIILAAASGTGIVTQVNSCSVDPTTGAKATNWVIILVSILMFLTSVTSTIQQFKNWGQVANQHQQAKANYATLEDDIRIALGVYRKDRQRGKDFVEWISKEFQGIEGSSPPIPERIQTQYQTLIKDKDIIHNDVIRKIKVKNQESNPGDDQPQNGQNDSLITYTTSQDSPTNTTSTTTNTTTNATNNSQDVPPTLNLDSIPLDGDNTIQRKKSYVELDVCEYESPFENDRYKYEIQRFLNSGNVTTLPP
jgi:hypothetical protein